jgi:hypothetical protein
MKSIDQHWLIAVAGLADTERQARQPNAGTTLFYGLLRHLASARWLHHFFRSASWTISALSRSSAYIFLSRRFSSLNSFRILHTLMRRRFPVQQFDYIVVAIAEYKNVFSHGVIPNDVTSQQRKAVDRFPHICCTRCQPDTQVRHFDHAISPTVASKRFRIDGSKSGATSMVSLPTPTDLTEFFLAFVSVAFGPLGASPVSLRGVKG